MAAELAADEWPSLAPIRTSCSGSNSSSFLCYEPRSTEHHLYTFPSPPSSSSSSSSHVIGSFLHASSTSTAKGGHGLLSKCLPPRPINAPSKGFSRQCINGSPAARLRHCVGGRGSVAAFRSYASFPGAQAGSIYSTAAAVNAASPSSPLHSNAACKSELLNVNAFTMIPAAVVGKKKPPDYLSDEPTSPEVTCIGRVRRSKNSTCNWDALVNGSTDEKLCKKKKKPATRKRIEFHHERRGSGDMDLQLAASIPRPLCMDSSKGARLLPKWRKIISLFKDIRDFHTPRIQIRKFREQEDMVINLEQLRRAARRIATASIRSADDNQIDDRESEKNAGGRARVFLQYTLGQSDEEEREGDDVNVDAAVLQYEEAATDDGGMQDGAAPPAPPPNACLLLMTNKSGRCKVFHNDNGESNQADDDNRGCVGVYPLSAGPPALPKVPTPPSSARQSIPKCNKKQAFSFGKAKSFLTPLLSKLL